MSRYIKLPVALLAITTSSYAYAATATFTTYGYVGGYTTNSNVANNASSFSSLSIGKVVVSDGTANQLFTKPQGNDLSATITVYDGSDNVITSFTGVINWTVKNGSTVLGIGVNAPANTADGYTLISPDTKRNYVLAVSPSLTPTSGTISGSADNRAVDALNAYVLVASPPSILDSAGTSSAASALSVDENQTAVTDLSSNVTGVLWSIESGNEGGQFSIDANGTITFNSAPDYENPTDADTNNTYILTVVATDPSNPSLQSSQQITVTVLDLNDTAPTITAADGSAAPSAISVDEGTTAVTTLAKDKGDWSIAAGNEGDLFSIDANGAITFNAAPDYEAPTDADKNNTYILTVEATDPVSGLKSTQQITVTVLDLNDTAPTITSADGSAAPSAISVDEGTTAVATLAKDKGDWSITAGNEGGLFSIDANGAITFNAAPDYEAPTDADKNNTYILTVEATDPVSGLKSSQQITVTVLDLNDTAPTITSADGSAAPSAVSVDEGTTAVTTLAKDKGDWSITAGNEGGLFSIDANGAITFNAAPDYEAPTDADKNNTYILTVEATDPVSGLKSSQQITVTVLNLDDTGPLIQGPSGAAGAASSAKQLAEGNTAVTTMTANETVKEWSIPSGPDKALFTINTTTGELSFVSAPDFENPNDADRNNTYVIVVRAVDEAGNISEQTVTITITNIDEIDRKLGEIGGRLRSDLRRYAFNSLNDMLSFNEGLMQDADGADGQACSATNATGKVNGRINANANGQEADLKYSKAFKGCEASTRIYLDAGVGLSRTNGNSNARTLTSARIEHTVAKGTTLGIGVMASLSDDKLTSFADSHISDKTVQVTLYGRTRLAENLRLGAFAGIGKAWYDFGLRDTGFILNGEMTGKRRVIGGSLSGDINVAGTKVTTDVILSQAVEHLDNAILRANYLGEKRSGIAFGVGTVDSTRLSVPLRIPFAIGNTYEDGTAKLRLEFSPGLLCQDSSADVSTLACGYQLGSKLAIRNGYFGRAYIDFNFESVQGTRRSLISAGYSHRFGTSKKMELGFNIDRGGFAGIGADTRTVIRLRFAQ